MLGVQQEVMAPTLAQENGENPVWPTPFGIAKRQRDGGLSSRNETGTPVSWLPWTICGPRRVSPGA